MKLLIIVLIAYGAFAQADVNRDDRCQSDEQMQLRKNSKRNCFAQGTLVATPLGNRPIEQIRVGDEVFAMNTEGKIVKRKVVQTFVNPHQNTCELTTTDGNHLRVTPSHHMYYKYDTSPTIEPKNLAVAQLSSLTEAYADYNELIPFLTGHWAASLIAPVEIKENVEIAASRLLKIQYFGYSHVEDVYNLEVDVDHNYFANGILVHNISF